MSSLAFPASAVPAQVRARAVALAGRGWKAYLVAAALLIPVVLPPGPMQLALLDLVNLLALFAFAILVITRRVRVVLPFVVPVLFIGAGSLLAITNAVSATASAVSLLQDLYLYSWFVMLVAVMARQGDLAGFRLAWVLAADVSALVVIGQAMAAGAFPAHFFAAEGFRPAGTFYGANMCADYLLLSVFVALSLWPRTGRPFLVFSALLMVVGLVVTKSNGSLGALAVGGAATALVWLLSRSGSRLRAAGALAVVAGLVLFATWAFDEWGSSARIAASGKATVLGRMSKSSAGRKEIWSNLGTQMKRHPLGIGPGNSVLQAVPIGHRERPGMSFQAKEAHSDYVAYAIERGPIGLVGHLLWVLAGLALVFQGAGMSRQKLLRAAFVGGLAASAVHSLVIEKLHFRHYWLFLALACALAAGERFRPEAREVTP
jgi:O-antigen ligase